jgi:hypothetical protein
MIISRPGFNDEMVFGNDGGVYYTANCTANPLITINKNNGYNVTQFYTVAYHPYYHSNYFLGGTQDNGTQRFEYPGINATTEAINADGAYCYIMQSNPRYQVTSKQWNIYYRSTDFGESFHHVASGDEHHQLIPPAAYDEESDVLYSSYNQDSLFRIQNFMHSHSSDYLHPLNLGDNLTCVRMHPFASDAVILGTRQGRIFSIENAQSDSDWNIYEWDTDDLPDGAVISIDYGPAHSQRLVVFSNYNTVSVWETMDGGTTWSGKEGNLPNMPIRYGIYNPYDYKQVLLATEVGVWTTEDITVANPVWVPCNGGLANVRVERFELRRSDMTLIAATHGRGIFTSSSLNAIPSQKVIASDGTDSIRLGFSADIFGNYAIAGARGYNQEQGAAYVFKFNGNTWEQTAKLTAINGIPGDLFGNSVVTDGDYAVIGSPHDNDKGDDAGAVYIFKRTGEVWAQQAKLTASDGAPSDHFGNDVAIYSKYVAVGSVALYKDTLVVGSPGCVGPALRYDGKISVFVRAGETWNLIEELEAGFGSEAWMGDDVALMGGYFVAGAPGYDSEPAENSGGIYLYRRTTYGWTSYSPPPSARLLVI